MNSPPFRLARISHQFALGLKQAGRSLPAMHLLKSRTMLIGGCAAAAAIAASAMLIGMSAPDPTQTAAVPPRPAMPQTAGTESPVTVANPAPAIASSPNVEPRAKEPIQQPAPARLADGPLPKPASTFEKLDQMATGPDERGSAPITTPEAAFAGMATVPDPARTIAIAPDTLRGSLDVQVAETEAEVAMLEAATGMLDDQAEPGEAAIGALDISQPELRPAKAAKWGNLRDGPADEAKVLVVVPANAAIEAETDCNWCAVVYKGQRGYMYKNLIRRSAAEEAQAGQGLF